MFITIEGIDGSGKTSLAKCLSRYLGTLLTCEPYLQKTRKAFKAKKDDPLEDLWLFVEDRKVHVKEVIQPVLDKGGTVIYDRYTDSTIAYQHYGNGIYLKTVRNMMSAITVPVPDLTLWLDLPVEAARERLTRRGNMDRYDAASFEYQKRVAKGYRKLRDEEPGRIICVCALFSQRRVLQEALDAVDYIMSLT